MSEGELKKRMRESSIDGFTLHTNIELEEVEEWKKRRYLPLDAAINLVDEIGKTFPHLIPQIPMSMVTVNDYINKELEPWRRKVFGSAENSQRPQKRMIRRETYKCPYCGYSQQDCFPIEHYESGSAGRRTFKCPQCGKEMEE